MRYPPPLLSLTAIVTGSSARSSAEYKVGDLVVVTSAQTLQTKSGELIRDRGYVYPGDTLRVGEVKGERLLLSNGVPGWLEAMHVVPLHTAADYFAKAIKCDPEDPALLFARAAVHMDVGAFDLAIDDFNELIKTHPESSGTWLLRGQVQYCRGELDLAMDNFNESLRLNPTDPNTYACLGNAWRAKGQHESAIQNYDAALEIDPQFVAGYIGRAQYYLTKCYFEKVIADLDVAIELDPLSVGAFSNRAFAWYAKGEYQRAIVDYDEVIRLDPQNARAYVDRGAAWWELKELVKSAADYSEAIRVDANCVDAYNNRGEVWRHLGEYDKAIDDFKEALQLDPTDPYRIQVMAWVWATCPEERCRNATMAIEYAIHACELTQYKEWRSVNSLAAAHAEAGDFEKAVRYGETTLDLCPENENASAREQLELYKAGKPYRDEPKETKP